MTVRQVVQVLSAPIDVITWDGALCVHLQCTFGYHHGIKEVGKWAIQN